MKRKVVIGMWLTATALTLIVGASAPLAVAKKGGNGGGGGGQEPPPAPAGTIYFTYDGATLAMDGNGANKTSVAAGSVSMTSSRLQYGTGYRWTLEVRPTTATYDRIIDANGDVIVEDWVQNEIVARRPGPNGTFEEIPITDLFGYVNPTDHPNDEPDLLRWSNDQGDTFRSRQGLAAGRDRVVSGAGGRPMRSSRTPMTTLISMTSVRNLSHEA